MSGKVYGTFRPATAPVGGRNTQAPQQQLREPEGPEGTPLDDPRHLDDSPMPWLRYFFPKDFNVREGQPTEPYYQHFDVCLQPLQEDTSIPPPHWVPNAYFQLSFTQMHVPHDMVLAMRIPKYPPPPSAIDLTQDNKSLLMPGNEKLLEDILAFCRNVVTFRARTWKDAFPLVDLLRGVLQYLMQHYTWGAALLREKAQKDAKDALDAEKARLKAWHQQQLEEIATKARRDYEQQLEDMKEQLRMTLAEDLAKDLRAERDEKEKLRQQLAALEAQLRRSHEQNTTLERQVAHLHQQIENEAARAKATLAARDSVIASLKEEADALRLRMATMQQCVVDALKARTKQDALDVAMAAIAQSMPGAGAYVAELRTAADAEEQDPSTALRAEVEAATAASGGADDGGEEGGASAESVLAPAITAMRNVTPGFLFSPLAAVVGGGLGAGPGSRPMSGGARSVSPARSPTRLSTTGMPAAVESAAASEIKETLVFKYIKATKNQQFMVGQKMSWGIGVSWGLVDGQRAVHVPDVGADQKVHYFKATPHGQEYLRHGAAYAAAAIIGRSGEVLGLIGVDTLAIAAAAATADADAHGAAPSAMLSSSDRNFLAGLADAISQRAQGDQDAFADAMLALAMAHAEAEAPEPPPAVVDPAPYAGDGLKGALKVFKEALEALQGLTDEELAALRSLDHVDDTTLAVLKSVLGAVGELKGDDWLHIRGHLTRDLLNRLAALDPQAAWAEWQALCAAFKPVNALPDASLEELAAASSADGASEAGAVEPSVRASGALARWVAAVRAVSAAKALQGLLEAKLQKANAALIKTFSGDSCHALTELRSYRVPPPITFATLQCVLMLCGQSEEDCRNWGMMRTLTSYKLIKRLITLRPAQVAKKVFKAVKKLLGDLSEDDVRKESQATLGLYHWLCDFTRLASVG